MICEDLLSNNLLKSGLTLKAGQAGLTRTITWIYFADCIECLNDQDNPAEWINGGELVVVTNESLTGNEPKLLLLMKAVNQKNVAGFVINSGQIPQSAIDLSNELNLPLFEISWNLKLIDLSQILCKALIEEESNENTLDHILFNILYSEDFSPTDLIFQANYYGVDLSQKCRMIVFDIDRFSNYLRTNNIKNEGKISEIKESLVKIIKNEFRIEGIRNIMCLAQNDSANILIQSKKFTREKLVSILENICKKFSSVNNGLTLTVGIGNSYEYIDELKLSLIEARKSVDISHIINQDNHIMFYKNTGIFSLLIQIDNGRILDNYYIGQLEPLMEVDKLQGSDLCDTLETYIRCNCNANIAADELFIHRNTMHYRLEKIKSILGRELSDMNVCMELNLAFHIKRYRKEILHKK